MATEPLPISSITFIPPTLFNQAGSTSSVLLLAANPFRKAFSIFNDSTSVLHVRKGVPASFTLFNVAIPSNGYFEAPQPVFTGDVYGIWDVATGFAKVTEYV
jgi:hypothetical protein